MKKRYISSGILIDDKKRLLFIKRKYNLENFPNYWTIPSGGKEEGETNEQAAIREVKEESGLDFEVTKLYIQDDFIIKEKDKHNIFHRYLGNYSGSIKIQEEECDGYGWFSYDEIQKLLITSNIKIIVEKLNEDGLIK